jgi:hypothetical protein
MAEVMHLIVDVEVLELPASSLLDLLLGSSVGSVIMYVDVAFSFSSMLFQLQ